MDVKSYFLNIMQIQEKNTAKYSSRYLDNIIIHIFHYNGKSNKIIMETKELLLHCLLYTRVNILYIYNTNSFVQINSHKINIVDLYYYSIYICHIYQCTTSALPIHIIVVDVTIYRKQYYNNNKTLA